MLLLRMAGDTNRLSQNVISMSRNSGFVQGAAQSKSQYNRRIFKALSPNCGTIRAASVSRNTAPQCGSQIQTEAEGLTDGAI